MLACVEQAAGRPPPPHHPFDEVDAGDLLGDAVLDLETRVDLEEVELVRRRRRRELDRAGAIDSSPTRRGGTAVAHSAARVASGRSGAGVSSIDLLVAALRRAIALAERHDVALAVAEDLHLDVPRVRDVLLEEDAAVLEVAAARGARRARYVGASSRASAHERMPMPPPPAVLLSITG